MQKTFKYENEIVISDTCILISFEKINKLEYLKLLCKNIYITPDVLKEYEEGGSKIPSFVKLKDVKNKNEIDNLLNNKLHLGEASSIALCKECKNPLLLTDDPHARKYVHDNNIQYSTTLDIIIVAREAGYIKSNEELHNILDDLVFKKRRMPIEIINEIKKNYKIENQNENNSKFTNKADKSLTHIINSELDLQKTPETDRIAVWRKIFRDMPKFVCEKLTELKKELMNKNKDNNINKKDNNKIKK